MQDVIEQLDQWRTHNEEIAITTVVETWGSAPRPVGSKMATTLSGKIAGSVSAGCVEGAVIEESIGVVTSGKPRLIEFGVADETAWEVGLACGGKIKVFIEPGSAIDSIYQPVKDNLTTGSPFFTVSVLAGPEDQINRKLLVSQDGEVFGDLDLGNERGDILSEANRVFKNEKSRILQHQSGTTLFIEVQPSPPKLIIVGGVHLAVPLVSMANTIGFETILIDPREAFASEERFPDVNQLIQEWPDEALGNIVLDHSAYIVILTHDPKLDDPALVSSLSSDARYVGALGSMRTNQKRLERLRNAGLSEDQLSRLHAPIGLDLGGRSSNEIAVSILAEIIQVRNRIT